MTAAPLFDVPSPVAASAVISEDGRYRYVLRRRWHAGGGTCLWVMLNPSTADATADDPTIRRCVGFSRAWGYGGLAVVNLFGLRSTDPAALVTHPDPVGPDNDAHLAAQTAAADLVVAAWGASWPRAHRDRVTDVGRTLAGKASHLGLTAAGYPRHPLYVRADARPQPWLGGESTA